ncbi:unnamed protein product [Amoebophrya sp. A120]|nr:unnamed protein product [Amoebophrya sp. A120]|eukprot:GSA120T00001856001.1
MMNNYTKREPPEVIVLSDSDVISVPGDRGSTVGQTRPAPEAPAETDSQEQLLFPRKGGKQQPTGSSSVGAQNNNLPDSQVVSTSQVDSQEQLVLQAAASFKNASSHLRKKESVGLIATENYNDQNYASFSLGAGSSSGTPFGVEKKLNKKVVTFRESSSEVEFVLDQSISSAVQDGSIGHRNDPGLKRFSPVLGNGAGTGGQGSSSSSNSPSRAPLVVPSSPSQHPLGSQAQQFSQRSASQKGTPSSASAKGPRVKTRTPGTGGSRTSKKAPKTPGTAKSGASSKAARSQQTPGGPPLSAGKRTPGQKTTTSGKRKNKATPKSSAREPENRDEFYDFVYEKLSDDAVSRWCSHFGLKVNAGKAFLAQKLEEILRFVFDGDEKSFLQTIAKAVVPGFGSSVIPLGGGSQHSNNRRTPNRNNEGHPLWSAALSEDANYHASSLEPESVPSGNDESLDARLIHAVRSETGLYEQMLLFTPVQPLEVQKLLRENHNIRIGLQVCVDFLERNSILYSK